jgi:DNA-binding transcriptional LysR family regulator
MKKRSNTKYPAIDFDLRQLEIFCRVVETKSFSKAAGMVYLAQASVSERISNLERMIGTRLLDRLGRQAVPTKAGELLYARALPLLDMKRSVCMDMEDFLGVRRGDICIGGSTIPGEYLLPAVLGEFRKMYPEVSVRIEISDTGGISDKVLNGKLELGIIGSHAPDKRLVHDKLWEDELVLAVPPSHPWAERGFVNLEEIVNAEAFILREEGSGTQKSLIDFLKNTNVNIESLTVAARLGTSTAVKEGVKAGLGIAILSYRALESDINYGLIKGLYVKDLPMKRSFYIIRDRRRTASPLCRVMTDFLIRAAQ